MAYDVLLDKVCFCKVLVASGTINEYSDWLTLNKLLNNNYNLYYAINIIMTLHSTL